jgi:hypothetical protein
MAAALLYAGISPGATIAFLLAGPGTNVTTYGVLADLHGQRIALAFGAAVVGLAITLGYLINATLPASYIPRTAADHADHHSWLQYASLAALLVVYAGAVLRKGPRGFLHTLFEMGLHSHDHDEDSPDQDDSCSPRGCCG